MKLCRFIVLTALGLFPFTGCSRPAQDMSKLKEELKREILAELRQQGEIPAEAPSRKAPEQRHEQMKAEIERDVLAKIESQVEHQVQSQVQTIANRSRDMDERSVQTQLGPVGNAEGYILHGGKGLQGCEVKLIRILKSRSVIEMFSAVREGAEFTTVTNEQGKYVFDRLPVGAYKLKWQLPGDKGWIRRLQDKPDAVITEGQATTLKSVETKRRLAGR